MSNITRKIGEKFKVRLGDDKVVTLQVCEEHVPLNSSPECDGCYFKHLRNELCEYHNSKAIKTLDCWKFKLHSHAGECWSAFRTDGKQVVFKKTDIDYENKDSENSRCDGDNR